MVPDNVLLNILSDGEFHSGEELGEALSVSRTAVWKQLKKIEQLGIQIESVKGKGYCLSGGLSLLDEQKIADSMGGALYGSVARFDVESVIESTNRNALDYSQANSGYPYICTAEQQTGGRGRRGKPWFSPYAQNLYFSVTWEFASGAAALEGLSLAVGVVVADVLAALGAGKTQLKWPNDILYDGRKLAGILLEISGDAAGPCQVVVGVGLNVAMTGATSVIDQPWVDLQAVLGERPDRSYVLGQMLKSIINLLASYEVDGFSQYRDRFAQRDMHEGKPVFVKFGDRVVAGDGAGVDSSGALLVDTVTGRQVFSGGEVSLRSADDT